MDRLLVIKPTALGDVAQALLLAHALKAGTGCRELLWIVDEDYAPLVRSCPWVDTVVGFPRKQWRGGFPATAILQWARELRRLQADTALDLQGLARSGLMTLASTAPRRIGLASAREGARLACTEIVADHALHAVDRYALAAAHLAGPDSPGPTGWKWNGPPELPNGLLPRNYTVLHPYSHWDTKLWPWQRFLELAASCPAETFVLVGNGPWFPARSPNIIDMRGQTPIHLLMSLLAHARVVVSTDSGPAHLAVLWNTPVLCIFGSTDPRRTAPRGQHVEILTAKIHCQPCLRRRCQIENTLKCMHEITIENVRDNWRKLAKLGEIAPHRK